MIYVSTATVILLLSSETLNIANYVDSSSQSCANQMTDFHHANVLFMGIPT